MALLRALLLLCACACAQAPPPPDDAFLIACARREPACEGHWAKPVPAAFAVRFHLSTGRSATATVTRAAAPPMADRFFLLASMSYFDGAPLYRVLRRSASEAFVAQWGYRASPAVDAAWLELQTSNATAAVAPPGNVRGALAFGTSEVAGPLPPNCSAPQCSRGFSVELFVNLVDNAKLDAADFSPFALFDGASMDAIDEAYAGYGECADLCAQEGGAADAYCVPDGAGGWAGVNLTRMIERGKPYLEQGFPRLAYVRRVELLGVDAALAPHPRLILTEARLADVKAAIASEPQAAAYFAALRAQGEFTLPRPPIPPPPANASSILMQARAVLTRTYVTALLFRLTGNETWAARCIEELLGFTSWPSWNIESHALDAGELAHAAAIAIDWTYPVLSRNASALAAAVAGLVARGADAFRAQYARGADWACEPSNWGCVTNGGAGMAALAVLGEAGAPAWLGDLLANATRGVRCSAASPAGDRSGGGWAPDGFWWEGPIYAGYAARYFVPFATALRTATGDDGGLLALPGVADAAHAQMLALDADWAYFNWADAEEAQETLAMLLAPAAAAGDGAAAFSLRARLDAATIPLTDIDAGAQTAMEYPHALVYWSGLGAAADRAALPLDAALPAKFVAYFRSSWEAPGATFVGIKGSNCSYNHGDLDAGTWVYSTGGQRFIADLGADNYALPEYFGSRRFAYYRKNSRGHNVLSFAGALHDAANCFAARANATTAFLASFESPSARVWPPAAGAPPATPCGKTAAEANCAAVDMTPAFASQGVASATRRWALDAATRTRLTVSDRWTLAAGAAPPANASAALHTFAAVAVAPDGASATLTRGAAAVRVSVPAGGACAGRARFAATPVRLQAPQYATPNLTRVDVFVDPRVCSGLDVLVEPA